MSRQITDRLRIAVGQLNPVVGDIEGNLEKAVRAHGEATAAGADLLLLTELFLSGYPPEDLVMRPAFRRACNEALLRLAATTATGAGIVVGSPWEEEGRSHNSVALLDAGAIKAINHKVELPNYGVFDEKRVFVPGAMPGPVDFRGVRLGMPICEDLWIEDVAECLEETGAEILLSPNGSPFWRGKPDERMQIVISRVVETGLPVIYANQVGGQDEVVFDGASFALNGDRTLAFQMPQFEEAVTTHEWRRTDGGWRCQDEAAEIPDAMAAAWHACVLGLRDYVNKNGFPGVLLGLSGGIDSAVCAAMSVDALGPERVHCIMLPYRYTSSSSLADAAECARLLGARYDTLPIEGPVEGFRKALAPLFADRPEDTTEENLQSRARGTILMAISNKFGSMLVTTGNKSEVSVGYATLYGDMNGGYNPIKDLYKTDVFALARWRNRAGIPGMLGPSGPVIPERIIEKPPSAELRADQRDEDSLPPYEVLDAILRGLVEEDRSVSDIVAEGHDRATVQEVEKLLYIAEYKRRQAAPGVKISRKNFGRDRRYPITNRYRDRG